MAELNAIMKEIVELDAARSKLTDQIKILKLQNNYAANTERLKDAKNRLYQYMVDNSLTVVGKYNIDKLTPAAQKKAERAERKMLDITGMLEPEIRDDTNLDELAVKIAKL